MEAGRSGLCSELGIKFSLARREKRNFQPALLGLGQNRPFNLNLAAICRRVLHLEGAAAAQLYAVVELRARRQAVGSEAGAGVVDLEQLNRAPGSILDRK